MKQLVIVSLGILVAGAAAAGTIIDIQTGVYAEGTAVTVNEAVVTGVLAEGFYMSEDPNQPYAGIWVFTGGGHAVATGDLVEVKGAYEEFFGRSQLNVDADATGYVDNLGVHTGAITPMYVSVHQLQSDPEAYESCYVSIIDPMQVNATPDGNGWWSAVSQMPGGPVLTFDDAWYDASTVMDDDCYCCATGIYSYGSGAFRLKPFAGAICVIDCSVDTEELSVSAVKTLFR
ncbi:MAG TPA: hypothetical protein P5571_01390 [Candidatus Krumholzibacteria bacterium]|nr:hypothetical protein [Candidatus Krumholzibacteria bacterium]HRX50010.1 hypothetical protein [Candidatus Krumholzibacteria bacterium]